MFLSGGVFVILQEQGLGMWPAMAVALGAGALVGAVNGALVAVFGLSALLTTLGMMLVVRGLGLNVIGGQQHNLPPVTEALRQVDVLGIPLYVAVAFAVAALIQWALVGTRGGRRLVAIGGDDASAAKLGIPVRGYVFGTYVAAGLLSALAGIASILNLGGVQTYLGKGQEFGFVPSPRSSSAASASSAAWEASCQGTLIGVLFLVVVERRAEPRGGVPLCVPLCDRGGDPDRDVCLCPVGREDGLRRGCDMLGVTKRSEAYGDVALADRPEPRARPGTVVLKTAGVGICGTDLHIFKNEYPVAPPVVLGHEVCGYVVDVGEGVDPALTGRRFVAETFYSTCGMCRHCRNGRTSLCRERHSNRQPCGRRHGAPRRGACPQPARPARCDVRRGRLPRRAARLRGKLPLRRRAPYRAG